MKILVTGGAGFIGSALVRHIVAVSDAEIVNLDKLTYAAAPEALEDCALSPRYSFRRLDICDGAAVSAALEADQPDAIVHLAAESHVDRSIDDPGDFVTTNIVGTFALLQAARGYIETLTGARRDHFRFLHVSTDEVFGALSAGDPPAAEQAPYRPNSPYAASKAASDHLVRAWGETYGLPVVCSNCTNNYGPWQYPEKLVPVMIARALDGRPLPVYGDGGNIRDWLHVSDHAAALWTILTRAPAGVRYTVGSRQERTNNQVVEAICAHMDRRFPDRAPHRRLIARVPDRPGHDFRYAIDPSKLEKDLGFRPAHTFEGGLAETIDWYLANEAWWRRRAASTAQADRRGLRVGLRRRAAKAPA